MSKIENDIIKFKLYNQYFPLYFYSKHLVVTNMSRGTRPVDHV